MIAVDRDRVLIVAAPSVTRSWIRDRFWRVIAGCGERAGHRLRIADESETQAMTAAAAMMSTTDRKEAS